MNIQREIVIATSPKNVWRALTNPYDLMNWASSECDSTEHRYVLSGETVFGGQIGGDVLERTEESTLRFQWALGGNPTEVSIRLEPQPQTYGTFTKVQLEHRNIPGDFRPSEQSAYPQDSFQVSWILWLRHLALWTERALVTGRFKYVDPLPAIVEKSVIIEADVQTVWRYITEPDLRQQWFTEPLGAEVKRIERNQVSFEWVQDTPSVVTFHVEPMANQRTLVLVHHEGLEPHILFDYHIGWQDYLVSLVRTASLPLIRQTIWIDAPPKRVWGWFTSQEAMQKWWNPSTVYEPKVGGRISFTDHGTELHGMVTELSPYTRFAFTFVESGTEGIREPFVVSIDLHPEQNGTRVIITQSGFDKLPEEIRDGVYTAYQWGWADSPELDRLAKVAENLMIYEMTMQVRVLDAAEGRQWYQKLLRKEPDFIPHDGFFEWELVPGSWLQVAEGTPAAGSGPLRFGVTDIESERARVMQELNVEAFEIYSRPEVPVKWGTFSDPWGNRIGFFEYFDPHEKQRVMERVLGLRP